MGLLILATTLLDVFRTLVMPRAARGRFRLSRLMFLFLWRPWRWVALRARTEEGRERILAGASPMSIAQISRRIVIRSSTSVISSCRRNSAHAPSGVSEK